MAGSQRRGGGQVTGAPTSSSVLDRRLATPYSIQAPSATGRSGVAASERSASVRSSRSVALMTGSAVVDGRRDHLQAKGSSAPEVLVLRPGSGGAYSVSSRVSSRSQAASIAASSVARSRASRASAAVSTVGDLPPRPSPWQVPTREALGCAESCASSGDSCSTRTATTIREFFDNDGRSHYSGSCRSNQHISRALRKQQLLSPAAEAASVLPCLPPGKVPGGRPTPGSDDRVRRELLYSTPAREQANLPLWAPA